MADGQAQALALACVLGGEEGFKNAVLDVAVDACTGVCNGDHDRPVDFSCVDGDDVIPLMFLRFPLARDGFSGVVKNIVDHLYRPAVMAHDRRQVWFNVDVQRY